MSAAWLDGNFVDRAALTIDPADFGFARGVALFELARIYGGIPLHLDDHLQRLAHGAGLLNIAMPRSLPALADAARAVIARNRFAHSALKFYLTAGQCGHEQHTLASCKDFTPHLMILETEMQPQHPDAPSGLDYYRRGQRLKTVPFMRELPMVKSINYMAGFYATREVAGAEWDDILFTHHEGHVTEATRSNLFCVIDGVLCTPGRGMLLGVTRKIVRQLAAQCGIPVQERDLRPADFARASEAFTTGSIAELMPAQRIDDHVFAQTMDAPVFQKLRRAFTAYIQAQCRQAA